MPAAPFAIDVSRDGRKSVLAVRGEVDLATAGELREALEHAAQSDAEEVWVDLSDVTFLDSTGLTALVIGHRVLSDRLVVICPDGAPRLALEICGMSELFRVCRDGDEAEAA